ncbi:MAG: T9SS type A sorting domain-containing protein [bacterium]|nr:T9SS type A sorting domain-containing protein [bacterium]
MRVMIILILFSLLNNAFTQISISRNEIPDSVGYIAPYLTSSNVQVNLGNTGGPQRWDFSIIPLTAIPTPQEIFSPNITPWNTTFNWGTTTNPRYAEMAQHAVDLFNLFTDSSMFWGYYRITSSNYELLGYGITNDLFLPDQAIKPSNAIRVMRIPLNFNTTWYDSFKAIIDIPDTGNVDLKLRTNLRFQNNVDAFGFLVCPQDSANVLRQVTVISGNIQIGTMVFNVFVPLSTQPIPTFTQVNFLAENKGIMVTAVSDTGVSTPNFNLATTLKQKGNRFNQLENHSFVFLPSSLEISAYPNPFNAVSFIQFSNNKNSYITLDVYNVNGRFQERLFQGWIYRNKKYVVPFSPNGASGTYFIRIQANGQQRSIRLLNLH